MFLSHPAPADPSLYLHIIYIPGEAALIHRLLHVMKTNAAVYYHFHSGPLQRHGGQHHRVPLTNPRHNVG